MRLPAPIRDPAGRFSALKAAALFGAFLPGLILTARWGMHDLGGRPITEATHVTGDWAVRFLLLSLAVTPARPVLDWPRALILRRMLGVTAAAYAIAHLLLYCLDQKWNLITVATEIVLRFYLTIGFVAVLGLTVLLVTSTDGWQKRLGRRWKQLHRIVFGLGVLALFHYFLQSKADVTNAVYATGLFVWLVLWRLVPRKHQGKLVLLPVLAVATFVLTALLEAAWYGLATRIPAGRVLWANLDVTDTLRPAVEVLLTACGLALLALGRKKLKAWRGIRRPPASSISRSALEGR